MGILGGWGAYRGRHTAVDLGTVWAAERMRTDMGSERTLLVADISGYTRFVVQNRAHWAHAQVIISSLLQSIISEAEPSLRLEKLEGDAAFFVGRGEGEDSAALAQQVEGMFESFAQALRRLLDSRLCGCAVCRGVEALRLKVVVHRGEVLPQSIAGHSEVSGVAVIVVHRLLKNDVPRKHYLLLTEAGLNAFPSAPARLETGEIDDPDLGEIPYWVHYPPDPLGLVPVGKVSWWVKMRLGLRFLINEYALAFGIGKGRPFRNLEESDAGLLGSDK